jgi:hypothetical protein
VFKGLHVDTAAPRADPSIEATIQARGRFISLAAPHRLHLLPVVSVAPRFVLIYLFLFLNFSSVFLAQASWEKTGQWALDVAISHHVGTILKIDAVAPSSIFHTSPTRWSCSLPLCAPNRAKVRLLVQFHLRSGATSPPPFAALLDLI